MEFVVFIILAVLLFAAWVWEKRETEETRTALRRCLAERNEETRLRCKYERENRALQKKCEELATENAIVAHDIAKLRSCTVEFAFSEWERKCCMDVPGRVLFERDGVVLIYECGKVVGWHGADTVQTVLRTTGLESEYEAPVAEVIE